MKKRAIIIREQKSLSFPLSADLVHFPSPAFHIVKSVSALGVEATKRLQAFLTPFLTHSVIDSLTLSSGETFFSIPFRNQCHWRFGGRFSTRIVSYCNNQQTPTPATTSRKMTPIVARRVRTNEEANSFPEPPTPRGVVVAHWKLEEIYCHDRYLAPVVGGALDWFASRGQGERFLHDRLQTMPRKCGSSCVTVQLSEDLSPNW